MPLFIVHVVALLVIKYDLCTLVQIGGLYQSYKLRGISRYGPPYRGIPRYGNSSRYPPLVNKDLKATTSLIQADFGESAWCEIPLDRNERVLVGCIYRSPNSSILNDENLNTFLHMASSFQSHLLLAGDFNHPEINWREGISPRDPNHKATLFLEAVRDAFLYQHVQNPTHYRHDQTANLLDLVFTNEEAMISEVQQLAPLGKSHHQVLNFSYTCYIQY